MAANDARSPNTPAPLMVGGSIAVTTLLAPIERVKLLLQCQNEMVRSGRLDKPYNGIIDCARRTIKNEGFLSLWRSNLVNLALHLSTSTLTIVLKEGIKHVEPLQIKKNDDISMKMGKNIAQSLSAGTLSMLLVYSLDYCRNRLACDVLSSEKGAKRQYSGIIDVYRKTLAADGIRGLYRGFVVSCLGIIVYRGLYFGLFDTFKPVVTGGGSGSVLELMLLGYSVTFAAGMLAYPFDTVRRRMMMRSGEPVKYKGAIDCTEYILKNEGFMSLMKGFSINLIKGVLAPVLLIIYDTVQYKLNKDVKD